jgi:hypothetical protein
MVKLTVTTVTLAVVKMGVPKSVEESGRDRVAWIIRGDDTLSEHTMLCWIRAGEFQCLNHA